MKKYRKHLHRLLLAAVVASLLCATAFASGGGTGDVASVVQSTWTSASGQIKSVVNNVVFPARTAGPCGTTGLWHG